MSIVHFMYPSTGSMIYGASQIEGCDCYSFYEPDAETYRNINHHFPEMSGFDTLSQFIDYGVVGNGTEILAARLRGDNWKHIRRTIQERSFRCVIIEGMAILRGRGLAEILKDFWTFGFNAEWHVVPANPLGAGYRGERLWIVAYPIPARFKTSRKLKKTERVLGYKYLTHDILDEFRIGPQRLRPKAPRSISDKPRVLRRDDRFARKVDSTRVRLLSDEVSPLVTEFVFWAINKDIQNGNRTVTDEEINPSEPIFDVTKRRNVNKHKQQLEELGIKFDSKNSGMHLVLKVKKRIVDYWPSTGRFRLRGTDVCGFGIEQLLAAVDNV